MFFSPVASSVTLSVIALAWMLPNAPAQDSKGKAAAQRWFHDFVAAEAEARQTKRPILVYAFDSI